MPAPPSVQPDPVVYVMKPIQHECSTCRWYDYREGRCVEKDRYVSDHDGRKCTEWTDARNKNPWTEPRKA